MECRREENQRTYHHNVWEHPDLEQHGRQHMENINLAIAAAEAINAPIDQAVTTNQAAVNKLYDELQKLIVLTKTDMPSKLRVTISYTDNDGD